MYLEDYKPKRMLIQYCNLMLVKQERNIKMNTESRIDKKR